MNRLHRLLFLTSLLIVLLVPAFNVLLSSFRQPGIYTLELDGISGYAQVRSDNLLCSTITLAFWVYESNPWPTGDFIIGAFSDYKQYENMSGYAMILMQNGGVRWAVGDGTIEYGYPITSGSDIVRRGEWTLIVGEYDSKTHVSLLYINGSALIGGRRECNLSFDNSSFLIGHSDGFPNYPVQVYNIQVYNRRLSVIELDNLFEQGVDGKPLDDSLVGWWLGSNQQPANVLDDLSGHGSDAEIKGEVQWIENIPHPLILEASEYISWFYETWSLVGFFFCNGLAWLSLGRKSENWLFLSASLFLFSAAFSHVVFLEPLSLVLTFLNVLLGGLVISLGGRSKVKRASRFTFVCLIAKDAPSRFFGFVAFSLFMVSSYIVALNGSLPSPFITSMYGALIALTVSVLVSTIKERSA
ncbi:MAG: hypothetical protein PVF15_00860 [Candidatus Bathyarchaeota archaeon]